MQWLRLYDDVLDDPKVQRLPPELFKHWINLLCLANRAQERGRIAGSFADLAFSLRVDEDACKRVVTALEKAGLVEVPDTGVLMPHNWDERQFKSDTSNERVKQYRERLSEVGGTTYVGHREQIMERDHGACVYCGSATKLVLDHLIPVQRGGDNEPDNLVAACKKCNAGKAGRLLEETTYTFRDPAQYTQYESARNRLSQRVTVTTPELVTAPDTEQKQRQRQNRTERPPVVPPSGDTPPKAKRERKISTPMVKDFDPGNEAFVWANRELGMRMDAIDRETDKFIDHWIGNGETKVDWSATWRNWMRRSQENFKGRARS